MSKGRIDVQTENIFPIIKKFLYSDHEIFLRELISNAVDATQKLKTLANKGEFNGELGDLTIEVKIDKKNKTLHIIDRGIGMTEEEVKKYINQIALSSANEFLEKFKSNSNIIGHFGLGFYSAFMVADKVEIDTKSYKEGAEAVRWICEGNPEYQIKKSKKKDRGTEIILHINEENKEFLEEYRIRQLLNKYCKFLPIPIKFGEREENIKAEDGKEKKVKVPNIINNTKPAWTKSPTELSDEDYLSFYQELYPGAEAPMFWIHLNVDYPFHLTGILYFPRLKKTVGVQQNKIQLYSNQVFVTDEVKEIVPEWLTLLHGVIDSPDIPLNVSRSYLQSDPNVKRINSYITKKVAEKLEELFKKDRDSFENKWDSIGIFVKYGMLSDDKFYEKAQNFCLLKNVDGKYFTIKEYEEKIKPLQTDKDGKLVILYASDKHQQHTYIAAAQKKGYDVLLMDTIIDTHFISLLEQKNDNWQFKRVDAEAINKLIDKGEENESLLTEKEREKLESLFREKIKDQNVELEFKPMSPEDQPVVMTHSEFSRRMKEMSQLGGMAMMGEMPDHYTLIVNTNHPVMSSLIRAKSDEKKERIIQQLYDIALLSQNKLQGDRLTGFIKRSVELMK